MAISTTKYYKSYKNVGDDSKIFDHILSTNQQELIADIQLVNGENECPNTYEEQLFSYSYPGTTIGCLCDAQKYTKGLIKERCCRPGEKDYWTTKTEYYYVTDGEGNRIQKSRIIQVPPDCTCFGQEFGANKPIILSKWGQINKLKNEYQPFRGCVKRQQGYNYLNNYPNQDQKGKLKCQNDNDMVCGKENNVICFPKNVGCPIIKILFSKKGTIPQEFQEREHYSRTVSENLDIQLNFMRMSINDENPIQNFQISGGEGVCQGGVANFSGQRPAHQLEIMSRQKCNDIDNQYISANTKIGEQTFFLLNDKEYVEKLKLLPNWVPFSNEEQFTLYYKEGPKGLKLQCRKLTKYYEQYNKKVNSYADRLYSIHVSFGFVVFFVIIVSAVQAIFITFFSGDLTLTAIINSIILIVKHIFTQPIFWTYLSKTNQDRNSLYDLLQVITIEECPKYQQLTAKLNNIDKISEKIEILKDWFIIMSIAYPEQIMFCLVLIVLLCSGIKQILKCFKVLFCRRKKQQNQKSKAQQNQINKDEKYIDDKIENQNNEQQYNQVQLQEMKQIQVINNFDKQQTIQKDIIEQIY